MSAHVSPGGGGMLSVPVSWYREAQIALELGQWYPRWDAAAIREVFATTIEIVSGGHSLLGVCDPHPQRRTIAISDRIVGTPLEPLIVTHELAHCLDAESSGYMLGAACTDLVELSQHERIAWALGALLLLPSSEMESMAVDPEGYVRQTDFPPALIAYRLALAPVVGERPQQPDSRAASLRALDDWKAWLHHAVAHLP